MAEKVLARRTDVEIRFNGTDITEDIMPYLLSMTYTDNEEGESDDLQIELQDRDSLWLKSWLNEAIEAASAARLKIEAVILPRFWRVGEADKNLPCGTFELDDVGAQGPPSTVSISATALPFSSQIRQTVKSQAWESYHLSGIAKEIASRNGMTCMYESAFDPFYKRKEQRKRSDIKFLEKLCKDAGISLKATDGTIVLFDQSSYEAKPPVTTIRRGEGYIQYSLSTGAADTQYASCRVSYVDPKGACIEGIAKTEDYNADDANNQQLEISAKVYTADEAKQLAEKHLRLHNKFYKTASFTLPGNPVLVSGVTLMLDGFGAWDGKYIIRQATHSVDGSGYTTKVELRKVLEGY